MTRRDAGGVMPDLELYAQVQETVGVIRQRTPMTPQVGIILGTGLGALADEITVGAPFPSGPLPHFPLSTVESHSGRLLMGTLGGRTVVAMQGRFHYYEGYTMRQIALPVRVMKLLGAETLLVSNACGGLNPQFRAGDIMVIRDHINFLGQNPLIGPNDTRLGPRFPDMSQPYDASLIALVENVALQERIRLQKGVYVAWPGPSLETAAEYRFLRMAGADVVGMSTVPEVIVAVHMGMRALGLSVVTDECFPDAREPVDIDRIIATANQAEPKLTKLMRKVVERL